MASNTFKLVEEDFKCYYDFKPGMRFIDMMPVIGDAYKLRETVKSMAAGIRERHPEGVDYIAAMELLGVPFGAPLAYELGCGLVIIRKPGKLPGPVYTTHSVKVYDETDLHIQKGAFPEGARVILVDDLIYYGGTLAAACRLLQMGGAKVLECDVIVDLPFLNGRENLQKEFPGVNVYGVMEFTPPKNLE
ncbi:Adenine phosphoribosyltransferase [Babesia ovata]|uniref:adenine phosphoribosyltransferase n=1 Tax=Babesia ovata TaxID=189622 RepID=A0A2H6KHX3_9APIC|nr:Adenine phosphoribosyltransferase [Babesia ovata]GBE62597.1 Adenine phosphoribosyltransferase [Babesia ovata]